MFLGNNIPQQEKKDYFKPSNKAIIEAIVKDDVDSLAEIILESDEAVNQEFGFDDYYLPRFLSSAPPIICVATYFNAPNCVDFLLNNGCDITKTDLLGRTIIHFAMASNNLDLVRTLDTGAVEFNTADKNGNFPIHVACEFGFYDAVKYIYLKTGVASLTSMNNSLTLPLLVAAYNGHLNIIKYLHDVGVNILDVDCNGLNALHYACAGGQSDVAKYLIDNGIDVDRTGHDSDPPILYAAQNGNLETVKLLIENGCKKYKQKNAKRSTVIEAAAYGHADVIKYLVSMGADIHTQNSQGESILSVSINKNQPEVIKLLIKEGMVPNRHQVISTMRTCFMNGYYDLFRVLWKYAKDLTQDQYDQFLNLINGYGFFGNEEEPREFKILRYMIKKGIVFSDSAIKIFLGRGSHRYHNCPKDVLDKLKKMCPNAFTSRKIYTRWGFY